MMRLGLRSAVVLSTLACSAGLMRADTKSGSLTIEKTTVVPGGTLKPGVYDIGIVDSLQDRMVVHIDGDSGKTHLLILAVPKSASDGNTGVHPVEWSSSVSGKHALRGFNFGSQYVEFVYPKSEAVAIANANGSSVVAVDPKSEGRPELNKLTSQDRQMVSLWMLSPVQVGPNQKGISAKHYTATPTVEAATPSPAPSTNVTSSRTNTSTASSTPTKTSSTTQVAGLQVPPAPKPYRPAIKRLPKTGSEMPLVWLVGGASLLGALTLRTRRTFTA